MDTQALSTIQGHPWFAATYDVLTRWSERHVLRPIRQCVVGAATGQVLEIGAGTGANFPYYPAGATITATEPDPFMLVRARQRRADARRRIALCQCQAEALPFTDASFDTVVVTLVLCTVADQDYALAEIGRVLKPGGMVRFIEHVRADGFVGRVQDLLTPLQRRIAAGCHLNRRTAEGMEAAGLEMVELEQRQLLRMPLIIGAARSR